MAAYFILMFVALQIASPVSTGAVFTLVPVMSAGFGWLFLRQTSGPVVLISLAVAAMGAIWVIFKGDIDAILGFRIGGERRSSFLAAWLMPPMRHWLKNSIVANR